MKTTKSNSSKTSALILAGGSHLMSGMFRWRQHEQDWHALPGL